MVTVDDATYVKMRDNLYGGDAGRASRAKAQIESSYSDEKYNNFITQLDSLGTKQNAGSTATTPTQTTPVEQPTQNETPAVQQTTQNQPETPVQTVPEVKQEGALKPLSQEYYNQTSEAAQNTIRDNLNRYKQTNPEYFTDYESFKKNFSYDTRSDEQKNTLDTWYKGYQDSLALAGTPTTDLYTQYQNGDLSAAQIEGLRISDPTKYAELQNQINKGNIIAAYDDDKGST